MNKPLLVGITGGIGSGKTTVAKVFQVLNIPIYFADDRGKYLLANDDDLKAKVQEIFGAQSYSQDGNLNRAYLAKEVFSDEEKLAQLNGLVHPAVADDFTQWVENNKEHEFVLKEAALLFETGTYKQLDKTISVMAAKSTRIERVLLRDDQRSRAEVENIIAKQTSDNQRKKLSDFLIQNEGKELLIPQVLKIHQELLEGSL